MRTVRLNEIYQTYKDRIEFFLIYIHEAHPSDGWQTPQNLYEEVILREPTTDDERAEVANACQIAHDIKLPMLLDGIDDAVEEAYVSEPIRLYVIDPDGIITYNGARGPAGFDLDEWEQKIRAQITAGEQAAE